MLCKRCPNMYYVKKRLVWVFCNRGERDKDNEIGMKEGRVIEIKIYSAFHIRDARSLSLFVFDLPFSLGNAWYVNASNAKLMSFNLPLNSISASFTPLPSTKMRLVVAPPNVNVPLEALTLICISCGQVSKSGTCITIVNRMTIRVLYT